MTKLITDQVQTFYVRKMVRTRLNNDTLVKNYLVQKSCATYPMENVERKQITN